MRDDENDGLERGRKGKIMSRLRNGAQTLCCSRAVYKLTMLQHGRREVQKGAMAKNVPTQQKEEKRRFSSDCL